MIYLHIYDTRLLADNEGKKILLNNLSHYLDTAPHDVKITYNINGKPLTTGFYFSISHCQHWLIQAFTEHGDIGIDLEYKDPNRSYLSLAKRYFHQQEYQHLLTLENQCAIDFFYRLWTTKEAVCKAKGGRLWYYLAYNYFNNKATDKESYLVNQAQKLNIRHFEKIESYSLSIASQCPTTRVRFCHE